MKMIRDRPSIACLGFFSFARALERKLCALTSTALSREKKTERKPSVDPAAATRSPTR
jgi:hypothetical protein